MKKNHGDHKLDNPVWFSLCETHQNFAVNYDPIKFYQPDYCPFGGFITTQDLSKQVEDYANIVDNFFVVGNRPKLSNQALLKKELVCLQMIIKNRIEVERTENIITLNNEHSAALFELVNAVQPGYFKNKTALLGNYYGIFKNGKLIAATGERMKMVDFIEVSAIVTHPRHNGKGYAKQLIAHAVNNIFINHKTPYLHVIENNFAAINLYEKLGFITRRKISFWNISK